VTFSDPNLASTSATFPIPGVYNLELTASNNLAQTSATLTVTATPPPGAFESWRTLHFGATPDPANAGELADPDHDGLANLLEFATGNLPNTPNGAIVHLAKSESSLEFTYRRSHAAVAHGIQFAVEWSDTLNSGWSSSGVTQHELPDTDDGISTTWKAMVPADSENRFVHLRVTNPSQP
jgi:hypothetical protein